MSQNLFFTLLKDETFPQEIDEFGEPESFHEFFENTEWKSCTRMPEV